MKSTPFFSYTPLREARNTLLALRENSLKLVLCVLLDALFFIMYGLLTTPFLNTLSELVITMAALVSDTLKNTGRAYQRSLLDIITTPAILPHVLTFFWYSLLLVLLIYVLYCFFQSIIWKLSTEMADYDIEWKKYLTNFFVINIVWFAIFIAYQVIDLFLDIRTTILLRTNPLYTPSQFFGVISTMLIITILYFVISSYISGGVRIGIKAGIAGWKEFTPALILIVALFLAINYLLLKLSMINLDFYYLLGILVFLPCLTLAKVYILRVARELAYDGILPYH